MGLTLEQTYTISVGDTEVIDVDFTPRLRDTESLTGTPTVVEITTSDLTLANKGVNTAEYENTVNGKTVAVGAGVQFSIAGGNAANSPYTIQVTVSTDGTPTRTMTRYLTISFA